MERKSFFKTEEDEAVDVVELEPEQSERETVQHYEPEPVQLQSDSDTYKNNKLVKLGLYASSAVLAVSLVVIAVTAITAEGLSEVPHVTEDVVTMESIDLPEIESSSESASVLGKWKELHNRNNHFVGWMKSGEVIDYPVMQYLEEEFDSNRYYLYRDFDGNRFYDGTLFVDWHTPIIDKNRPHNTIIYGHNLSTGRMFASLMRYYSRPGGRDLSYYKENPTVDFTTVYDDDRNTYKIFAAMFVNSDDRHGDVFTYWRQRFFEDKKDFYDFIGEVMDRSVFYTDVDIEFGDEILTMSTCYYPLGNDTDRFVVFARRVREGESKKVDVSKAVMNTDPKYFDYFYIHHGGGEWGGRKWNLSKVKGFEEFYKDN